MRGLFAIYVSVLATSEAFAPRTRRYLLPLTTLSSTPEGQGEDDVPSESLSDSLFASLRGRQAELELENQAIFRRWRSGQCRSTIGVALNDWVRRLDLNWPLVSVGTSQGGVFVINLESTKVVAGAQSAHPGHIETDDEMTLLHGDYDGGRSEAAGVPAYMLEPGGYGASRSHLCAPDAAL